MAVRRSRRPACHSPSAAAIGSAPAHLARRRLRVRLRRVARHASLDRALPLAHHERGIVGNRIRSAGPHSVSELAVLRPARRRGEAVDRVEPRSADRPRGRAAMGDFQRLDERALLVEEAGYRGRLWTSRVWLARCSSTARSPAPGAVRRRRSPSETWRRLSGAERHAVEVAALPLPGTVGESAAHWLV